MRHIMIHLLLPLIIIINMGWNSCIYSRFSTQTKWIKLNASRLRNNSPLLNWMGSISTRLAIHSATLQEEKKSVHWCVTAALWENKYHCIFTMLTSTRYKMTLLTLFLMSHQIVDMFSFEGNILHPPSYPLAPASAALFIPAGLQTFPSASAVLCFMFQLENGITLTRQTESVNIIFLLNNCMFKVPLLAYKNPNISMLLLALLWDRTDTLYYFCYQ